jgi:hypothetical protein
VVQVQGRYVVIKSKPGKIMHLAEVQAFGTDGKLLTARNAAMSSTYKSSPAGNCIDGSLENTNEISCCHVSITDAQGKLWIDYGQDVAVSTIEVTNRKDDGRTHSCGIDDGICTLPERIVGGTISVTNDPDGMVDVAWTSTFVTNQETYTFTVVPITWSMVEDNCGCMANNNGGTSDAPFSHVARSH